MGYKSKQVTKTRRVQKTRQVPNGQGGHTSEIFFVDEPYVITESVWVPDSSSGSSFDGGSSGGSYGE